MLFGDIYGDGSAFGGRVASQGFSALTEPIGSRNVPFDTRDLYIGNVVATGLAQCGGGPVYFPTMPYVPIVNIYEWDGVNRFALYNIKRFVNTNAGQYLAHYWYPALAIVDQSSIEITAFSLPYYNPLVWYNPNGKWYAYSVFATG